MQDYITTPRINHVCFPADELPAVLKLLQQMTMLAYYPVSLEMALRLFDFSGNSLAEHERQQKEGPKTEAASREFRALEREVHETMNTLAAWMHIAARDGAMQIYHVGMAMQEVRDGLRHCPTMMSWVNHDQLRSSVKLFESQFPRNDDIRNAVGHAGEIDRVEEAVRGPFVIPGLRAEEGAVGFIAGHIAGRTYATTVNNQILTYELSAETLDKLRRVVVSFFKGFDDVVAVSNASKRGALQQRVNA